MVKILSFIHSRPGLLIPIGMAVLVISAEIMLTSGLSLWLTIVGFVLLLWIAAEALRQERAISLEAFRESETIAHALLDASTDAAILIDRDETILFVNDAGALLVGCAKNELVGKNLRRIIDFLRFAQWSENLSAAILVCQPQVFTTQHGGRYLENRVYPISNVQGDVVRLALFSRDVTEQKKIERSLRDNSDFLQTIINHMPVTMFVKDAERRQFLIWNKFSESMYGITANEALGKTSYDLFPREQADLFRERDTEMLASGNILDTSEETVESPVLGTLFLRTIRVPIYDDEGAPKYILGFSENITERRKSFSALKKSEHRLRKAQEAAQIGSWELDIPRQNMWATERSFRIYGLEVTPDACMPLASVQRIVQTHDRERMDQALGDLIAYNTYYDVEYKINRFSDGEARILHSRAEILRDSENRPKKVFGTIQDVTERKLLEHQLIQAQKLEGIGTLAGGIAHDFNNLLAMVLSTAELLKKRIADDPAQHRHIDRIIETAHRGTSITKQLLLFSRQDDAELEAISLSHIITEIQDMMTHFLPKDITVRVDIAVHNGLIMGDSGYIHQALMNLAINSRDAMPDGGVLTFSEHSIDSASLRSRFSGVEDGAYIALSVSDSGVGMKEEIRKKIFDPFFTTKERGKGTGLGLAIVHSIVKSHHGFIEVQSEPGKGTTFLMYFPTVVQREPERAEPKTGPVKDTETILLVDDEDIIREMLQEQLQEYGYVVMTAANGVEALEKYREYGASIDLVITDLGMPRMDGATLFKKLFELNNAVKMIVSSGYLDNSSKSDMKERGIKDVLTKPYRFADIQKAIRTVLDRPNQ
jgi:PAS domain S-box-containing protein